MFEIKLDYKGELCFKGDFCFGHLGTYTNDQVLIMTEDFRIKKWHHC